MCGECCGAWNLPVSNKLKDKLLTYNWVLELLQHKKTQFIFKNNEFCLPKKNGICIFMDTKDNLCLLHKRLGESLKPKECNRFPFAFAKDKNNNLYIDTSFYCKSIVRNEGENIKHFLSDEFISSFDLFEFPEKVLLSPELSIDYSILNNIRINLSNYLIDNFNNETINNYDIVLYRGFIALKYIEKTLINNMEINFTQIFKDCDSLAINKKKLIGKLNFLTTLFIRKNSIIAGLICLKLKYSKYIEPIIAEPIDLKKLEKTTISEYDDSKKLIKHYLIDIINRKILLAHKHSAIGIFTATIIAYSFIIWYSKALAVVDGKSQVEQFHIELAIRITERYYIGHNVKFMERVRKKNSLYLLNAFLKF